MIERSDAKPADPTFTTSAQLTPVEDCCRDLAWDSAHFGIRIARVNASRLTPGLLAEIDNWRRVHATHCLYYLADPDFASMRLATGAGFRFVDARITLEVALAEPDAAGEAIRPAKPEDIPELRRIAGESHRNARFHADGNFPIAACDELYRIWIERSCREPKLADAVFVVENGGRAAGYISCRMDNGIGEIGLVAVDERYRGLRLGERLLAQACSWFLSQGARSALVVTQGANVPALRLYQKAGFLITGVQLWYHRWFR
jgi:ribosomal protein S18 acetylase RimI-like enzyme